MNRGRSDSFGFRHFIYGFLVVHAVLFPLSGFRAWVQVYKVELAANSDNATAGTRVAANVVTSGRIGIDVEVVAHQGDQTFPLVSTRIPSNVQAIYDPRPARDSIQFVLNEELVDKLSPGAVTITATATGRPQFTRMPPPVSKSITLNVIR